MPGPFSFNILITGLEENAAMRSTTRSKQPLFHAPVWSSIPAKKAGSVLVSAGADGKLRAFSSADGTPAWTSSAEADPVDMLADVKFVVVKGREKLSAHSASTGARLWDSDKAGQLLGMTDKIVLSTTRDGVEATVVATGETAWKQDTHQDVTISSGLAFVVSGERNEREILQARNLDDGAIAWETSDGDIGEVVPGPNSILYSSVKIGKHKQEVQYLSSRGVDGARKWIHLCSGELRATPHFSPDGNRVAIVEQNPADPSRSFVTLLNAENGNVLLSVPAAYQSEVNFLDSGNLLVSETEFSRVPDTEEKRVRLLAPDGTEKWARDGRPNWTVGGSNLIVADGNRLSRLSEESGQPLWSREFEGEIAPVSAGQTKLQLLVDGCELLDLNPQTGATRANFCSGDKLLVETGSDYISDHDGRVWEGTGSDADSAPIRGDWEKSEPTQFSFLSGPAKRGGKDAVFVDWDGTESDDGEDPILVDSDNAVVAWKELTNKDKTGSGRLETEQLRDYKLWFDINGDGEVSSASELSPLVEDSSFDKGRFELTQNRLWLAYQSGCQSCEQ